MRNKFKMIFAVFLFIILFTSVCNASEVEISKTISDHKINVSDVVSVTLTVRNKAQDKVNGKIIDIYPKFATVYPRRASKMDFVPKLEWNFSLRSNESKECVYQMSFDGIPNSPSPEKNISISAAILSFDGKQIKSKQSWIYIVNITKTENCNYNFECEPEFGENSNTCIQDCPVSGKDGFCDNRLDNICDPDCEAGKDPDCGKPENITSTTTSTMETTETTQTTVSEEEKTECGNDICEKGEDSDSCPEDCGTHFPYYILWTFIIIIILIIVLMIIYKSKTSFGGSYE